MGQKCLCVCRKLNRRWIVLENMCTLQKKLQMSQLEAVRLSLTLQWSVQLRPACLWKPTMETLFFHFETKGTGFYPPSILQLNKHVNLQFSILLVTVYESDETKFIVNWEMLVRMYSPLSKSLWKSLQQNLTLSSWLCYVVAILP